MKKRRTLFFQICMIFAMLAVPTVLSAYVVQAEETVTVPRATFTNEENVTPDLFVTKQVTTADQAYPAPEDSVFSFVLKLDERLAAGVTYRVFEANGTEVFLYEDGQSTEDKPNKLLFKTDTNGDFTLLGGQTAKFTYVGKGKSYEIKENETKSYEQIEPAGGVAAGTVEATGSTVIFKNEYQPEVPKTPGEEKTTVLTVKKRVSMPDGYAVSDLPDFTFTATIDGESWADKEYTLYNDQTGLAVSTERTGDDGSFTMTANQSVSFEGVPEGVDYKVEEKFSQEQLDEGWHVSENAVKQGATKSPVTSLTYTNLFASFVVSKTLSDNTTSEEAFSFTLKDGAGTAWPDASYYLYTTNGVRVDDTTYKTGAKGDFTLQAGQSALFIGIPSKTPYQVSESVKSGYTQKIPTSADGYTGKTVIDAVEVLSFVNEKIAEGSFTVTKVVENGSDELLPKGDKFTFTLTKKDGDTYTPVAGAVYEIRSGSGTKTYKTDDEGKFTLQKNQSAIFKKLTRSATYRVQETGSINYNLGILAINGEKVEAGADQDALEGELSGTLAFSFTNIYQPPAFQIELKKTNSKGENLSGATWGLYTDEACTEEAQSSGSGEDGLFSYGELRPGTYYVKETKAPEGYSLLTNPIKVELTREEGVPILTVNGDNYDTVAEGDDNYDEVAAQAIYMEYTREAVIAHITVENHKKFELPLSGGSGILLSTALLLSGIAILTLLWKRRIQREG